MNPMRVSRESCMLILDNALTRLLDIVMCPSPRAGRPAPRHGGRAKGYRDVDHP